MESVTFPVFIAKMSLAWLQVCVSESDDDILTIIESCSLHLDFRDKLNRKHVLLSLLCADQFIPA